MWAPKRLELAWGDLAYAGIQCLKPGEREVPSSAVAEGWMDGRHALACLSVRSGLDLVLAALDLPPGSEVLMSAINIPDMAQIVRQHGLVAVPIDVDRETLHVTTEEVRKPISPQTRVLLVAHLFGRLAELGEIADLAQRHNLLLIEDCAQAFVGHSFSGHAASDVAMFSFGPIKTATALGGAVLRVKDPALRDRMAALQARHPRQRRRQYFARVLKYAALKMLTTRPLYGAFVRGLRKLGIDHARFVRGRLHSFHDRDDLLHAIRRRPSRPLLAMLRRRIQRFDETELRARAANGHRLAAALAQREVDVIRPRVSDTYWVFPQRTRDSGHLAACLLAQGFDVARRSSLTALDPTESTHAIPREAREFMKSVVFLPAYNEMRADELDRLADSVAEVDAAPIMSPSAASGNAA